jgi:enamine deaminase RidA (YjgF/YER057c/UK114 family)
MTVSYENPAELGKPLGKYSHMSFAGGLTFVAGQVGARADGTLVSPDLAEQVRQVFANIRTALEARGGGLRDVLKSTTYLTDASLLASFAAAREEVYADAYPDGAYPPNTLVVVAGLVRPEYLVEIDAVAYVEEGTHRGGAAS